MNVKKKVFMILGIFLLIVLVILVIVVLVANINKDRKQLPQPTTLEPGKYEILVHANTLVKLVFEINSKCKDAQVVCIQTSSNVVDYDLVNDEAKEVYKKTDFRGKSVYDSIVLLCDEAYNNGFLVKDVKITSPYNINDKSIEEYVKNHSSNNLDIIITYEHREIELPVTTTTSETTTTETTETTTQTTESNVSHEGYINLNDNVRVTVKEPCGMYYRVSDDCMDMTVGQIKTKYPGYKTTKLEEIKKNMNFDDNTKTIELIKKYPLTFSEAFQLCSQNVPSGLCNKKESGAYTTCKGNGLSIHYLETSNSKYKDYFKGSEVLKNLSEQKMNYESRNCVDGNDSVTLTEELCNKYYLKCDRW